MPAMRVGGTCAEVRDEVRERCVTRASCHIRVYYVEYEEYRGHPRRLKTFV